MKKEFDLPSEHPPQKASASLALVALLLALISIASAALLIRFSEREIGPSATVFNRFWIATAVLGLWNGFKAVRSRISHRKPRQPSLYPGWVWGGLLAAGICLSGDILLWAWALTQTSVANSTLLANLTPLFSTVGAWLVWRRRFDSRFLAGMCVGLGGAVAVGIQDFSCATGKVDGDIAALLAAICFSVYLLVLEKLQTRLEKTAILFWTSASASLFALPFALTAGGSIFPGSWQGWVAAVSLAVVCQVLGQALLVYSLNALSSEFVALSFLLEPVLAAIGAGALFSERLNLGNWLAFATVLLGMYLALSSKSAVKAAEEDSTETGDALTSFEALPETDMLPYAQLLGVCEEYSQELGTEVEAGRLLEGFDFEPFGTVQDTATELGAGTCR
ncbi:MAG: DMT family transporter [Oscillatoria princeps RMCB-10]|jgi:drug/metabolite transporter (DMT)-like permease|nr:DMT family transporter [Oscillatoria princeps RMCB-10]